MGSSALGIRFASTELAYQKGFANPGFQPAGLRRYLEPRTGTCSVSFAYGGYSAGRYGSHGRDALDHRDFRHGGVFREQAAARVGDRKSTRLNSSHVAISYAVFCLKKK